MGAGEKSPEIINVFVEITRGSQNKYEFDKEAGVFRLDRVLYSPMHYPLDYGFVPQSLWHDNDPLDVVLLTTFPLLPGVLVRARPVAIMNMIDGGEGDDKIIAVPKNDPRWEEVTELEHVNKHTIKEIQHFLETYKTIDGKTVQITGIEGRAAAQEAVLKGLTMYQEKFKK